MAATQKTQGTGNPSPTSSADLTDLTIAVNRIAANQRQANAYEIRNAILVDEEKERVRYKNGITELPCSVQRLFADAQRRNANHRRTLARNIVHASGQSRPADACAHHIVALNDDRAALSRRRLFGWLIAINDADNGVFLPRYTSRPLSTHPQAPHHGSELHTPVYHAAVYARLRGADANDPAAGRQRLRSISQQLLVDTFPR